jgi:predicted flap endonuclease-1-like 5' DNA nuclease
MAVKLMSIRGMTEEVASKLNERAITNSDELLAACATDAKRRELAECVGVEKRTIKELANRADLTRVQGVNEAYADLIENAGVETVKELAGRRADNLQAKLAQVHADTQRKMAVPPVEMVEKWIESAKALPIILEN